MDSEFSERSWQSPDGLELYFREYPGGGSDKVPVLCLHGLTRNSRDFDALAPHIASRGHRVIVPDMRGRGQSAYADDSSTYAVPTYIADVMALCEELQVKRFISIGTSMGGLMTMLIAQFAPDRIAGAVINDIGPVVDPLSRTDHQRIATRPTSEVHAVDGASDPVEGSVRVSLSWRARRGRCLGDGLVRGAVAGRQHRIAIAEQRLRRVGARARRRTLRFRSALRAPRNPAFGRSAAHRPPACSSCNGRVDIMKEFVILTFVGLTLAGFCLGLVLDDGGSPTLPATLLGVGLWLTLVGAVGFPPRR